MGKLCSCTRFAACGVCHRADDCQVEKKEEEPASNLALSFSVAY